MSAVRRPVDDSGDSSTSCATVCACAGCRRSRDGSNAHTSTDGTMTDDNYQNEKNKQRSLAASLAPTHLSGGAATMTSGRPATTARAGCSSADADQPRNLNSCYCRRDKASSRTRQRTHPGGISTGTRRPSLLLLAVLLGSLAVLPPSIVAAEAEAAAPEMSENNPSRKRPRHRNVGTVVTGDISQIISFRLHPHPAPTAEPTFAPTLEDDDDDDDDDGESYDGGMPQPRNERPWEELQNSTDIADEESTMEGRDAENEDDEDEDSDEEEDEEKDPASDDGNLVNLLDQVDNGGATKTTNNIDGDDDDVDADADTKGTDGTGGTEIIDVSPGEYAVPLTPAPAAMPVIPPTTTSPTAAPVTAPPTDSPTRKPTLAPTKKPTPGELVQTS